MGSTEIFSCLEKKNPLYKRREYIPDDAKDFCLLWKQRLEPMWSLSSSRVPPAEIKPSQRAVSPLDSSPGSSGSSANHQPRVQILISLPPCNEGFLMIRASLPTALGWRHPSALLDFRTQSLWAASPLEHRQQGSGTCRRCSLQALITEAGQVGFFLMVGCAGRSRAFTLATNHASSECFILPCRNRLSWRGRAGVTRGDARKRYAGARRVWNRTGAGHTWHSKPGKLWRIKELPWWPGTAAWQDSGEHSNVRVFSQATGQECQC